MEQNGKHVKVGVVGLGLMGSALADRLVASGFEVTVWNRSPAKAERFARAGVRVAATVTQAAEACDILVVCLLDHESTQATVMTPAATRALAGRAVVQLTTMTAQQAHALGTWAQEAGIACLEGQVLNYPDDIRAGRGAIVCSGPRGVYDTCRSALEAMAPMSPHLSETRGAAAILDKALGEVLFPCYMGFLHGAAMCEAVGVPVALYSELMLRACFGDGLAERTLAEMTARLVRRSYGDDVKAALDTYSAAFVMTLHESETLGMESAHLRGVDALLRQACAAGHGKHDFAAVFELFRRGDSSEPSLAELPGDGRPASIRKK